MSRILVISWYSTQRPDSGERVRLAGLVNALQKTHDLEVLSFEASQPLPSAAFSESVPYRTNTRTVVKSAIAFRSYYEDVLVGRRDVRALARATVARFKPALFIVNQLPPWGLLLPNERHRAIVDTHNAEFPRLQRMAQLSPRLSPRRMLYRQQAKAARDLERLISETAGGVWAVTARDVEYFASLGANPVLVPNGVSPPVELFRTEATTPRNEVRAIFVGSLTYSANLDALRYFMSTWASSATRVRWSLEIVGSGDPSEARRIVAGDPRVSVRGRVPNISDAYRSADVLVVPLRMGGGSRLKVIEAMAHGLPVISTTVGMEGIPADERHYLRAETGGDFAAALEGLCRKDVVARVVGNAHDLSREYDWEQIVRTANNSILELERRLQSET